MTKQNVKREYKERLDTILRGVFCGSPTSRSVLWCQLRIQDGSHVVNYIQWTTADKLAAAHHSPEFRKKWPEFGKIAEEIEPCLYEVVHVEAA